MYCSATVHRKFKPCLKKQIGNEKNLEGGSDGLFQTLSKIMSITLDKVSVWKNLTEMVQETS